MHESTKAKQNFEKNRKLTHVSVERLLIFNKQNSEALLMLMQIKITISMDKQN